MVRVFKLKNDTKIKLRENYNLTRGMANNNFSTIKNLNTEFSNFNYSDSQNLVPFLTLVEDLHPKYI